MELAVALLPREEEVTGEERKGQVGALALGEAARRVLSTASRRPRARRHGSTSRVGLRRPRPYCR